MASQEEKSKEGAERGGEQPGILARSIAGAVKQEALDGRRIARVHRDSAGPRDLIPQPLADERHVHEQRLRCQSPVVAQILHVLGEYVVPG